MLNRKTIVAVVVLSGFIASLEIGGRSSKPSYEQYMNWTGLQQKTSTSDNADAATKNAIKTTPQINYTTEPAKLSSRGNVNREAKIKRINQFLKNGLSNKGNVIVNAGIKHNVNPYLMTAIIKHETGDGTSKVFRTRNNVAGLMTNGMTYKRYNSIDESIFSLAKILSEFYIAEGRVDIESIGAKFCPVGAYNDRKTQVNQHWVPNVSKLYAEITEGLDAN